MKIKSIDKARDLIRSLNGKTFSSRDLGVANAAKVCARLLSLREIALVEVIPQPRGGRELRVYKAASKGGFTFDEYRCLFPEYFTDPKLKGRTRKHTLDA